MSAQANLRKPVKNVRYELGSTTRNSALRNIKIHNPGFYLKKKLYEKRMKDAKSSVFDVKI